MRHTIPKPAFFRFALAILVLLALAAFLLIVSEKSKPVNENGKPSKSSQFHKRPSPAMASGTERPVRRNDEILSAVARNEISHEEAWNELLKSDSLPARRISDQSYIIRCLARENGAPAALEFLNSRVGPGTLRITLLSDVFADACNNLDDSLKALGLLEFPEEELEAAIEGIGSSYVTNERDGFDMDLVISKAPSSVLPEIARSVIFSLGRRNEENRTEIQGEAVRIYNAAANALGDRPENCLALEQIYGALISDFPMAAWKVLSTSPDTPPEHVTQSSRDLISAMVVEDPIVTMKEIAVFQGNDRTKFAEEAAYLIAKRNMADVNNVITSVPPLQQDEIGDFFAMGIIRYASEVDDTANAEAWTKTIRDPKLKLKAEQLLDH